MFTGIIKAKLNVSNVLKEQGLVRYSVHLLENMLDDLTNGASISVDGICQTVVKIQGNNVWFDAINETLEKTTLKFLKVDNLVNIERSAKLSDEIGGHLLSGHIFGTGKISNIISPDLNNKIFEIKVPKEWMKYIMPKGFIAIDGASLTICETDNSKGLFNVHLIPETLKITTFDQKQIGDFVNIEIDSQTQTIVNTVENFLKGTAQRPSPTILE